MKLYDFPWGPYPLRITIYLAEKGITDAEVIKLQPPLDGFAWPPSFIRELTPAGTFPVIVDDDGTTVAQSIAILEYLEETRDGPDMIGATPAERARTRELVAVFDEAIAFFGVWARHGSALNAGKVESNLAVAAIGAQRYGQKLRLAERMIGDGDFLAHGRVTIADCVAAATLHFTGRLYGVAIPTDCPKLATWYDGFFIRGSVPPLGVPPEQLAIAYGLPEQTGIDA